MTRQAGTGWRPVLQKTRRSSTHSQDDSDRHASPRRSGGGNAPWRRASRAPLRPPPVPALVRGAVPLADGDPVVAVGRAAGDVLREPDADQLVPRARYRRDAGAAADEFVRAVSAA